MAGTAGKKRDKEAESKKVFYLAVVAILTVP
jgi:hypothetical protein